MDYYYYFFYSRTFGRPVSDAWWAIIRGRVFRGGNVRAIFRESASDGGHWHAGAVSLQINAVVSYAGRCSGVGGTRRNKGDAGPQLISSACCARGWRTGFRDGGVFDQ